MVRRGWGWREEGPPLILSTGKKLGNLISRPPLSRLGVQERLGIVQPQLSTTSSPVPLSLPPPTHQPEASLHLVGLLSYFCGNAFCWSAMSGWIMKFKLGPFDFQWLNICESNSGAAMQLKRILECWSHSTRHPTLQRLSWGNFFSPDGHLQRHLPRDADNLHHYSKPAYQWAQPDGANAWATFSLFSGPHSQVFKNHLRGYRDKGTGNAKLMDIFFTNK